MKRIIAFLISVVLLALPGFSAYAAAADGEIIECGEDGSYYVTAVSDKAPYEDENENELTFLTKLLELFKKIIAFLTGKQTVSKTKYVSYYDSRGTLLWTVFLTASFTYNGKEAVCTGASVSHDIVDTDWKMQTAECSKAENTARGFFAVRQYKLGLPLKTIEKELTLRCDTKGNVT